MALSVLFCAVLVAPQTPAARTAPANTDVVFREDFEKFDRKRWDELGRHPSNIEVVAGGVGGGKCVQITANLGVDTGGHLYKMLEEGLEKCHLRFYVKFEAKHDYLHHFVHLVGYRPATRWPQGGAGTRPKGDERFSTGIEPWGNWARHSPPGAWHFYSYWCEMKGSRDGKFWGNSFAPDPPVQVERGKWICVEIMLKCNAPDKADGEQALWLDGEKVAHFRGIRWRKDRRLLVNGVWMLYYITENAARQNRVNDPRKRNRVWFDEIVVSESYVGPELERQGKAVGPLPIADVDESAIAELAADVAKRAAAPIGYVVGKFAEHDVVLLGEHHQVRQNCEFVAQLLEPAYHAGVRVLATEFLRTRHNADAERLVTGAKFDRQLALRLMRDLPWPTWGFREYLAILERAWRVNRGRPRDAPPLRVVGIDSDWSQVAMWRNRGSNMPALLARERNMQETIEREALEKGQKVLVHVGFAHTVTCHGVRLGTELRKAHGARVCQIALHHDVPPAITGVLERVFTEAGGEPVGLDLRDTPLGRLRDPKSMFARMLPEATLGQIAEGWVFLTPVSKLQKTSWIAGFIDDAHLEEARYVAIEAEWIGADDAKTAGALDRVLRAKFPRDR